jgi:hypothetical protein
VTDNGHVLRPVAGSEAREMLAEDHVQDPVQAVLHTPSALAPSGRRTEHRAQANSGFEFDHSVSLDLGFNAADHGEVREHGFARVMPIRGHPVDLMADRVPAGFDPAPRSDPPPHSFQIRCCPVDR